MIGTVVGNYKVVSKIGEGGMGAVFKGIDLMLEREVAIKVLKPELASQPHVVERFRSEAVTLAKLNHPNIATLYSFFRQGDYFFMVLEYVNGTPLDKLIESYGLMTCEQAIPLFSQMLEGIDHAHALRVVHRDIKPANMMLTENGLLKVLDFGIARALGSARMTRAGHLIGTIEYMSPEQVRGMDTDARSDIYSLGMVLYEMLTGRVPFASDSEFELMKAQVEQLPTPPREFAPSIPAEVEWAILCATEKDPAKRFQTAGAFGEAIVDSVNTAVATGTLSPIDMRRPTSRLSAAMVGGDQGNSRVSRNSAPGPVQSNSLLSSEIPAVETTPLYPPTRFAQPLDELQSQLAMPKPTRLGVPSDVGEANRLTAEFAPANRVQNSFFVNLTRTHYALGGTVLGVLFLGFLAIVLAFFLKGGRNGDTDANAAPSKPSPIEQGSPADFQQGSQVSTPQPEVAPVRRDQPADNPPVRALQDGLDTAPELAQPTPKLNKAPRTNAARNKARQSSRDIMGAP